MEVRVREPLEVGHVSRVRLTLVLEQGRCARVVALLEKLGEIWNLHPRVATGLAALVLGARRRPAGL